MTNKKEISLLRDFIGISHWQSAIALLVLLMLFIGFAFFIKRTKPKFPIRILIGLLLGLSFGIIIQAVNNFTPNIKSKMAVESSNSKWIAEVASWTELLKTFFITGITMLSIPIVFLAIARICAQKKQKGLELVKISTSGITILLINVAVAFTIAFSLGIFFKIGSGFKLSETGNYEKTFIKTLPNLINGYIPTSFIGVFTKNSIIPVIILAVLIGNAIKILTKRNEEAMDKARSSLEIMWKIVISILTFFIKIMPYAILSIMATFIINNPISDIKRIGIIIAVAYFALILTFIWHLLTLWLFGVNPFVWTKKTYRPLITGFTTQSSNVALPIALETLKTDLKIKNNVADTIMPLSTTIGLSGCAGVQSGIIAAFLWHSYLLNNANVGSWTITILGLNAIFVTIIASLGIAGTPGTASVVTSAVLNSLGFGMLFASVYGVIGALDGILDMGRTLVNISGGMQATTIVARNKNMIADDNLKITLYPLLPCVNFNKKLSIYRKINHHLHSALLKERLSYRKLRQTQQTKAEREKLKQQNYENIKNIKKKKVITKALIKQIKSDYQQQIQQLKIKYENALSQNTTNNKALIKTMKKQLNTNLNQLYEKQLQTITLTIESTFT